VRIILKNASCLGETTFENLKAVGSQEGLKQVRQLVVTVQPSRNINFSKSAYAVT